MEETPFIEYKRANKERSDKLRKEMTLAEKKLWFDVLLSRPRGYKFLRQKRIKGFILDFYCSKLLLCVEVDGSSHNNKQEYDKQRDASIKEVGITTIRYTNNQVIKNIGEVFDHLLVIIRKREEELEIK